MTELRKETLKKMLQAIAATRDEEYDCGLCLDELEKFVELEFEGLSGAETYPLIKHHLDSCIGCGEEYKALFDALNGLQSSVA